jgi:hypothetical protein
MSQAEVGDWLIWSTWDPKDNNRHEIISIDWFTYTLTSNFYYKNKFYPAGSLVGKEMTWTFNQFDDASNGYWMLRKPNAINLKKLLNNSKYQNMWE